ncbi:uncharacterized protein N7482_008811 [Penicillium canariense]|uniref:HNH nuclease domain-containing protein n=1 Tax=Penicillium canariense TaxID=189055 RepID=A0A9W9HUH5_9EURO|nr:uncharacterized protein N7482_008811 [Penicillium canariense]KAJ5157711.1 hypothetical protein N7482_008811 [Penicillium canariense]
MPSSSKIKLDQKLNSYIRLGPTDKTREFLREFFKVLPPNGKRNLAGDLSGCANDEKLRQLVQSIRTGLLIPLKAQGGKTPNEFSLSPWLGVKDSIDYLKSPNIKPISRSSQWHLWHRCLERDGNKCVATGVYSHGHAHPPKALTSHLEAAHIIPFALRSFQANDSEAVDRYPKIWVNLRRYFPVLRSMAFTSDQIDSEKNILMLDMSLHREFGQFALIFEATSIAHEYRIKTFPNCPTGPLRDLPKNRLVKFRVHKGSRELPDPKLLKIHACIGNFLHTSGQAEIIDKLLQDFEDCGGLAPSGSTNLEDLLAASGLSSLPSNFNEASDSQKYTKKQHPTETQGSQQTGEIS